MFVKILVAALVAVQTNAVQLEQSQGDGQGGGPAITGFTQTGQKGLGGLAQTGQKGLGGLAQTEDMGGP